MQLLTVLLAVTGIYTQDFGLRILGGESSQPNEFPFAVSISDPNQYCDGVIIDTQWVLTAAHCLQEVSPTTTVLIGTNDRTSGGTVYSIIRTIIHEDYDRRTLKNDIGLIRINDTLEYDEMVQPVEFGDGEENETCIAAGWGITLDDDYPDVLQHVKLRAVGFERCKKAFDGVLKSLYLGPEQVCTMGKMGVGVCRADSGGPLVCGGKLAGLVSFGTQPCGWGLPDVYTRPSAYAGWIEKNIRGEN